MTRHPANRGLVMLTAWVEPTLRDHAREVAREAGLDFSVFVAEAVRRDVARRSAERAVALADARERSVAAMKRTSICSECRQPRCMCVPA